MRYGLWGAVLGAAAILGACVPIEQPNATAGTSSRTTTAAPVAEAANPQFEQDRAAILAMTGEYAVSFNFTETVALTEGYELKEPKLSGGMEVVRVIEDTGRSISLQHTLLVGPNTDIVVKHWRQDWVYEPATIWDFVGRNAWEVRELSAAERAGKWAQLVYQVDDAPRYAALAPWVHDNNVSSWTSPVSWRPLPRRDATTRDDYDVVVAVNRHALTPSGWVHEQDNSKLVLDPEPSYLVREIGVNTYVRDDSYDPAPADAYWDATGAYWAAIRAEWSRIVSEHDRFGFTIQGEPEALYMPVLGLASGVADGTLETDAAVTDAIEIIRSFLVTGEAAGNPDADGMVSDDTY